MAVKKKTANRNTGGRPSSFKDEYAERAFHYCLLGATDVEMAKFFGVTEKTLNNWKLKQPKFLQALKDGKGEADASVAHALFHKAIGYSHKETKVFCDKGAITTFEVIKHYPPDMASCAMWLNNRRRIDWKKRPDLYEDDEDEPTPVSITINMVDASK